MVSAFSLVTRKLSNMSLSFNKCQVLVFISNDIKLKNKKNANFIANIIIEIFIFINHKVEYSSEITSKKTNLKWN